MKAFCVLTIAALLVMGIIMTASAFTVTGNYYRYALFPSASTVYKGGGDVDCYGETIYVNRDGTNMDVYEVSISDMSKRDQHPDNPDATGPMLPRTLTYVKSYYVPEMKTPTTGCLYATATKVYFLDGSGISYVNLSDGSRYSTSVTSGNYSQLGYDDVNDTWYASSESAREVYSWNGSNWVLQFSWEPGYGGSHMDGLEVVTDPDTNIPYVYVSDMTSDYIGQYRYDTTTSSWVNDNIFAYAAAGAGNVEGMGFGALGHFWATTGFSDSGDLYEVGGGELGGYTPPPPSGVIPEPSTIVLLGFGLLGLIGLGRRNLRKFKK